MLLHVLDVCAYQHTIRQPKGNTAAISAKFTAPSVLSLAFGLQTLLAVEAKVRNSEDAGMEQKKQDIINELMDEMSSDSHISKNQHAYL